jgi:hypothetical protein
VIILRSDNEIDGWRAAGDFDAFGLGDAPGDNDLGVSTRSSKGQAYMSFTGEISSTEQLQRALKVISAVKGVAEVKRV